MAEPVTAVPRASATGPALTLQVSRRTVIADRVVQLELRDPGGGPLPAWQPGAHVDLDLGAGLVRQYSLCGDPADAGCWRVAVLRVDEGRGGSRAVHDRLTEGALLAVRGPRNAFPFRPAGRYLFLAGGIGITPILPMLAGAEAAGADWQLLYGGRTRAAMAFLPQLRGYGSKVTVVPQDEAGLLPLDSVLAVPRPDTAVYACGPEPMLAAVERLCAAWPAQALHLERFAPAGSVAPAGLIAPAGPANPAGPGGSPDPASRPGQAEAGGSEREEFSVELAATGRRLGVPAGRSILEVLEAAGVGVLSSCRAGTCGTCEVGVLGGEIEHRDTLLPPEVRAAGDTMLICVSRARGGRLVLDL